jgi:hypothetical protein
MMTDPAIPNILDNIISLRGAVGEGLNDEELTFLLRQQALPSEAGFTFVSLFDGCATFNVPPQNPANWYPEKGWIAPEKESLAKAIAQRCGYSLGEPPDGRSSAFKLQGCEPRHHLQMSCQDQVAVIAHPSYLKVRLFDAWTKRPISVPPNILERLANLYRN